MQLLISEMVDQLESMKTVAERKEFLYKNRNTRLKEFFEHSYGKVDWYIDDEEQLPEWYPATEEKGYTPSTIVHEIRRIYVLYKDTDISDVRKNSLFSQMLESVHPDEANILISMLMGNFKIKGVSKKSLTEVWDDIKFKGEEEK